MKNPIPKRPRCVVCLVRVKEFEYKSGKATCLLCIEKENERKARIRVTTRDAEYWKAYRKYLRVG